jgi:hypothetical protein
MDQEYLAARQQRASEYIQENERLTGDLADEQARPLIEWASYQASTFAADPTRSDDDVDTLLMALRRVVSYIARTAPDEHNPTTLIALAEQTLRHTLESGETT